MTPSQIWVIAQWVGIVSATAATVGGLIAAFKAVYEWKRSTLQRQDELKQRELEFRQKQAVFARDCIRDIFANQSSRAALRMLDWLENEYEDGRGTTFMISRAETKEALRVKNTDFSDKEVFIRGCFESLYDALDQLENLVQVGILNFDDLVPAFRYYMERVRSPELEHTAFLTTYDYGMAKAFVERFTAAGAGSTDALSRTKLIEGDRREPPPLPEPFAPPDRRPRALRIAGTMFALLACAALIELVVDPEGTIGRIHLPFIASAALLLASTGLSWWMWSAARKSNSSGRIADSTA